MYRIEGSKKQNNIDMYDKLTKKTEKNWECIYFGPTPYPTNSQNGYRMLIVTAILAVLISIKEKSKLIILI